ncbi:MAG: hypothetical protein GXP42_12895 [Chloroflexi bacterium]|nr:hypothetical protein [Chloroflexota bacterium]
MRFLGTDPLVYFLILAGLLFTMTVGIIAEQRTLMPVLNALILWPFLIWSFRHARIDVAVRLIIFWSALIFLFALVATRLDERAARAAVPGSIEFGAEHMLWLAGSAAGVDQFSEWFPLFLRRTGVLLVGSAVSAGLIPLIVAAREMAILGIWTGNLLGASNLLVVIFGVPLWIWAEAAAWIAIGAVLAEPIVTGDIHAILTRDRLRLLLTGVAAWLLSFLLHLLWPPVMQSLLRPWFTFS